MVSALLELTWDRVDFDRRQINLRNEGDNTRKGRAFVPINDGLYIALQTARDGALSDYVVKWAGGPVRSIRKGLSAVGQRVGSAELPALALP